MFNKFCSIAITRSVFESYLKSDKHLMFSPLYVNKYLKLLFCLTYTFFNEQIREGNILKWCLLISIIFCIFLISFFFSDIFLILKPETCVLLITNDNQSSIFKVLHTLHKPGLWNFILYHTKYYSRSRWTNIYVFETLKNYQVDYNWFTKGFVNFLVFSKQKSGLIFCACKTISFAL